MSAELIGMPKLITDIGSAINPAPTAVPVINKLECNIFQILMSALTFHKTN